MWIRSSKCDSSHCLEANFQNSSYCDNASCLRAAYHKSSYSDANGNCLEAAYKKSSRSGQSNGACLEAAYKSASFCDITACVEAAYQGTVLVRDSKMLDKATGEYHGEILSFTGPDWEKFLANLPERP